MLGNLHIYIIYAILNKSTIFVFAKWSARQFSLYLMNIPWIYLNLIWIYLGPKHPVSRKTVVRMLSYDRLRKKAYIPELIRLAMFVHQIKTKLPCRSLWCTRSKNLWFVQWPLICILSHGPKHPVLRRTVVRILSYGRFRKEVYIPELIR